MSEQPLLRRIRSFVRREGRMTPSQQRAMTELWPRYGIEADGQPIDTEQAFGRQAPLVVDIGFGNGESLLHMARIYPDWNFLGIEVHRPGVGGLMLQLEEQGIDNVRVMDEDAVEILAQQLVDASVHKVLLFFPDPWHKKRHHKRRIVQPGFAQLVHRKLMRNGEFHMATDWQNYAEHMLEVMEAADGYENIAGAGQFSERPNYRPVTKFERRGQRLGHGVWDLIYRKLE
ncbi:MAG: tRNA (guanosine(46)-N7)-methyltransferase TrmB [Gammaproteobacteria bacterium]|nr:tRNA (guanosine(46)-N7)-methyltransferase TrmB [Gammaproteobacteria bacterium]